MGFVFDLKTNNQIVRTVQTIFFDVSYLPIFASGSILNGYFFQT